MKKFIVLLSLLLFAGYISKAQNTVFSLGSANTFYHHLLNHTLSSNNLQTIAVEENKSFNVHIYTQNEQQIIGNLQNDESTFLLQKEGNKVRGFLVSSISKNEAYRFESSSDGELLVCAALAEEFICINYGANNTNTIEKTDAINLEYAWDAYKLESFAGASAVIYLDFDGHNLPAGTAWNNGAALSAAASGFSDVEILTAWNITAEDYAPFNVNVTTDVAVYNATPNGKRMRVIVTPTSYWSQGGGVALLGSFTNKTDQVCWVFKDKLNGAVSAGECASHEAGHTLTLKHDGQTSDYYQGHADWAPIMGASYYRNLSQWSIGDYSNATNQQDDLAAIATILGYRNDDHGNTINSASELSYTLDNLGKAILGNNSGIIEKRSDVDLFHFYLAGGNIDLQISASALPRPNLDMEIKLLDKNNQVLATVSHNHKNFTNDIVLQKALPAGDYYLQIDGVGTGNASTGWTDYGSLGKFSIKGTIEGIEQKNYDIALEEIKNISSKNCGSSLSPTLLILNNGKTSVNSLTVEVKLDGAIASTKNYNISIASGQRDSLVLSDISISSFGNKNVEIIISQPNGFADEILSNNTKNIDFNIQDGLLFEFSISTASVSNTMTWNIKNGNQTVMTNTSNNYVVTNGQKTQQFCLANASCFDFTISNAFLLDLCNMYSAWNSATIYNVGDKCVYQGKVYEAITQIWGANPVDYSQYYKSLGACPKPNQNDYFYLINKAENNTIMQQKVSEYSSQQNASFCTDFSTATQHIQHNEIVAYPNPFVNEIQFSQAVEKAIIYSSLGQEVLTIYNTQNIHFNELLPSGIYFLSLNYLNKAEISTLVKF
jgi:hypothetical protein